MLELLSNPAIVALIAGIPSVTLAVFGYWRAAILDKRAEASGTLGQIIEGLRVLVASLQKDNEMLRQSPELAGERIALAIERIATSAETLNGRGKVRPR